LLAHFQSKALRDLSVAYETIRPSTVAEYLGIDSMTDEPSANVVQALTAKGWEWNSESKLFHPKPDAQNAVLNGTEKIKIGQLATLIAGHSRQSV
jgi:COP9 signalosome complex subunit 8